MIILDCSQVSYAAYYALPDLAHKELEVGVIYGFLQTVFNLAKTFKTNKFVFCWDSGRSFRKDYYPEYKSGRSENLSEDDKRRIRMIIDQRATLRMDILPRMGFKNSFIQTGMEGDDLIASIAIRYPGNYVLSSDNDLWQILDYCTILNPYKKEKLTPKTFFERWGIPPKKWAEVKELHGCPGDGVPGIKGVGEIKAIQYITGKLPDGVIKKRIESEEGHKIRERNRVLTRLPFNGVKEFKIRDESFNIDSWKPLFIDYGFRSFLTKKFLEGLRGSFNG